MRLEALGRFLVVMLLGSWSYAWAQEAKPAEPVPAGGTPAPAEAAQQPAAPAPAAPAPAPEVKPVLPAPAPEPPKPQTFQFAMHGFVGVTLFAQDGVTRPSEGGLAMFAAPQNAGNGGTRPLTDKAIFNGDVRQSRFNFSVAGPEVIGATPRGVLEIDFFGGFGAGNYGSISLTPRMRLAYAELDWGRNRLLFGQQNDLTIAMVSYSLSHLANPLSFVTGMVGWRRPGVFGYHTVAGDRKDTFLEFAWEVGAPLWANNASIGGANAAPQAAGSVLAGGDRFGFNNGEASGVPAVEARLLLGQGTKYQVYVTGHYNKVDRSGVGATSTPNVSNLDVMVAQVGGKAVVGPLTLQTQAFTGKNLAPLTGAFLQFQANTVKDIHEYGAYVQAGYNFTPEFSVWGMLGSDRIDPEDAREAHAAAGTYGVTQNTVSQGFLQYRVASLGFSLEWTHFLTRTLGATAADDAKLKVNQWAFNCIYFM